MTPSVEQARLDKAERDRRRLWLDEAEVTLRERGFDVTPAVRSDLEYYHDEERPEEWRQPEHDERELEDRDDRELAALLDRLGGRRMVSRSPDLSADGEPILERDGYLPGVPCWVDTSQPDPEAAVAFYGGLFGWSFEDAMPPGSAAMYFIARLRGGDVAAVGSQPEGAPAMPVWNTYVWVENADDAAAKVEDAGGRVVTDAFDLTDLCRIAVLTDPEGATFRVWQAKEHKGARIVNQPGSLNFNGLSTRDAEAARSFYRSVFGWETLGLAGGAMAWTLPGYGDFVKRSDPGLRKRMADAGVPEGFEDVIATLNPVADDQSNTPAHWGVTFSVDDADATAERAAELGGQVVVPPFDAPFVRMTVIIDPQGASFIASEFVPENRRR